MEGAGAESLQEMVMERDGKFEVLSSVDLQAQQLGQEPEPSHTAHEASAEEAADSRANTSNTQHASVEERNTAGGEEEEKQVVHSQPSDGSKKRETVPHNDVRSEQSQPIQVQNNDATTEDRGLSEANAVNSSDNEVRFSEPASQPVSASADTTVGRTTAATLVPTRSFLVVTQNGEMKQVQRTRTQSAPGPRSMRAARQQREGEEERERRQQLSEAAFKAWIQRKNDILVEKRRCEREKSKSTEEDEQRKREMCEMAYQNWLVAKNMEWQKQRALLRPSTSVPKKDEATCRQAFESWMKKKQAQHLEEVKMKEMRTREIKESAEKADPSVIDRAYKE